MNRFSGAAPARAILCAALLLTLPAAYAADGFKVSAAQMKSLGITVQRLNANAQPGGMSYPARVVLPPQNEQVLSAPVAGMVDRILISENQVVRAGQPLLRLTSPEFGELQLQLMEASSAHRLAQQTLQRERKLFSEGIIPKRRIFEAEAAASTSHARDRQARAALRLAGLDNRSINAIAGGGALQDGLTLRAKTPATVLSLQVKPGQRVDGADPLLHMATLDRLWLDIQVPASRASSWSATRQIKVPGRGVVAEPRSVGSMVSASQTVTLRAEVVEGADQLRPGEFVQAIVPGAATASAWTLPITAVARQGKNAYVFVRSADGFTAKAVKVVSSAGQTVTVTGPLKPSDQVAVTSVIALKAAWLGESGGE